MRLWIRARLNKFCILQRNFLNELSIIVVECCPLKQERMNFDLNNNNDNWVTLKFEYIIRHCLPIMFCHYSGYGFPWCCLLLQSVSICFLMIILFGYRFSIMLKKQTKIIYTLMAVSIVELNYYRYLHNLSSSSSSTTSWCFFLMNTVRSVSQISSSIGYLPIEYL